VRTFEKLAGVYARNARKPQLLALPGLRVTGALRLPEVDEPVTACINGESSLQFMTDT